MNQFFGPYTAMTFLGYFLFALFGLWLSLSLQANKRDPNASTTPFHFTWAFLLSDNVKRIVTSLALIYVAIRFSKEMFGLEMNDWKAVVTGLGLDKLSEVIKNNWSALQENRSKQTDKT